jgi:hypothetical protein
MTNRDANRLSMRAKSQGPARTTPSSNDVSHSTSMRYHRQMRSVCIGLVAIFAACYQPALKEGAPCGMGDSCPSGQECRAGTCFFTTTPADATRGIDSNLLPEIDAAVPYVPWGTAVENNSLEITGVTNETDPTISANHLVVALSGTVSAGDQDIFIGTRNAPTDAFTVSPATALNTGSEEECPELSADGKTIYFTSNRAGQYDVYISTESNGVWSPPMIVPALSTRDDSNIAVSPDGLTAIVLDEAATNVFYLHTRASTSSAWSGGTALPDLEITDDIASPSLTNNAETIYFHAGQPRDLYVAHRKPNNKFTTPVAISELNTTLRDACPFVLQADDYMIFDHDGDIYETTR